MKQMALLATVLCAVGALFGFAMLVWPAFYAQSSLHTASEAAQAKHYLLATILLIGGVVAASSNWKWYKELS